MWALKANRGLVVKSLVIVVVVVLAAAGVYIGFIKKGANKNKPIISDTSQPAQPSVVEQVDAPSAKAALAASDYATYQSTEQSDALFYLNNSQTSDAERVMNNVINNVPPSNITSGSYLLMMSIQRTKKDTTQEKKYLQLAIQKLNDEGNTQQAASQQKYLDSLK